MFKNYWRSNSKIVGYGWLGVQEVPFCDSVEMKYVFQPKGGTDAEKTSQYFGASSSEVPVYAST